MKHALELLEDFLRAYFDKLLLTAILLLLIYVGRWADLEKTKEWAMGQANTVIGAIIMLTTGKVVDAIRNRGEKPVPAPALAPTPAPPPEN